MHATFVHVEGGNLADITIHAHLHEGLGLHLQEAGTEGTALLLEDSAAPLEVGAEGADFVDVGTVDSPALPTHSPAAGKLFNGCGHLSVDLLEVGGGLVVVGSEETTGLAVVPAGDADSAVVVGEVAGDLDTMVVVDAEGVANAVDSSVLGDDGHLGTASVDLDTELGQDFDLVLAVDDSDGLLGALDAVALVVDYNAEGSVDHVTGQQVAALSGELEELLVKGHVVLGSRDGGMS